MIGAIRPTLVVVDSGSVKEVQIRMTSKEYQAARECFPGN